MPAENWSNPHGDYNMPRPFTNEFFLTKKTRRFYPTSLMLPLFLFKYYANKKMSNWYRSRKNQHSEVHHCSLTFFEIFLPTDSNIQSPT